MLALLATSFMTASRMQSWPESMARPEPRHRRFHPFARLFRRKRG